MIDIVPIQLERVIQRPLSCLDDVIATIAGYHNREFRGIFYTRWNFDFKINDDTLTVGDKISIPFKNEIPILEKFYGIAINEIYFNSYQELLEIIKKETDNKRPVIVSFDAYECPWDEFYQLVHNNHLCIALGVNTEEVIMCDPYFLIRKEKISLSQYQKGYKYCFLSNIQEYQIQFSELEIQFKDYLEQVNVCFDKIRTFADFFETNFNPKIELDGEEHYYSTKLYTQLNIIIWNRWMFVIFLQYLNENTSKNFNEIVSDFKVLTNLWNVVRTMIAKIFYMKDTKNTINRVAERIRSIALLEEEIHKKILQVYDKDQDHGFTKMDLEGPTPIQPQYINLEAYFNNKGLSNSLNVKDRADLTELGEYIVIDRCKVNILSENNIKVGNGRKEDNISCCGQKISLGNQHINYINFIGCSEWGSYEDIVVLKLKNGKIERVSLGLTDLCEEPNFNEEVFLTGKSYHYENELIFLKQKKASIFKKKIPISKKLNSIQLPNCKNMHIFSIQIV